MHLPNITAAFFCNVWNVEFFSLFKRFNHRVPKFSGWIKTFNLQLKVFGYRRLDGQTGQKLIFDPWIFNLEVEKI